MPLKKARGKSQKSINNAVSHNIVLLKKENENLPAGKKRSHAQIVAIAEKFGRGKK